MPNLLPGFSIAPYAAVYREMDDRLSSFIDRNPLPEWSQQRHSSFVSQLADSVRRVHYVEYLRHVQLDASCADPADTGRFDPLRAALYFDQHDQFDQSFWMLFLFVHFGKHRTSGYQLSRQIYGGSRLDDPWTWRRIIEELDEFEKDLSEIYPQVRGSRAKFGNHRKYESIRPESSSSVFNVVSSYVEWVGPTLGHRQMFAGRTSLCGNDPEARFAALDVSMKDVARFGRTARFDYLSMASKLGILDIVPGHAYLKGATGPARGARLLLTGDAKAKKSIPELNSGLEQLHLHLAVGFDVIEDAICNWQKSPDKFTRFQG